MTRPFLWLAVALAAAPAFAWIVYRLAKGLGFLEPPADRQHELRRTIVVAVYAFLLFLPVLFYGFEKRWPRAWIIFGIVDGLALVFFAASGWWAARALWKLRHPEPELPEPAPDDAEPHPDALANAAMRGGAAAEAPALPDPPIGR
ncbi:MAG TPA: hypothetical protein VIZ69_09515 [Thermoanaerobaculia bacterium]